MWEAPEAFWEAPGPWEASGRCPAPRGPLCSFGFSKMDGGGVLGVQSLLCERISGPGAPESQEGGSAASNLSPPKKTDRRRLGRPGSRVWGYYPESATSHGQENS